MPPDPTKKPRAWQRMLSGRRLDLLDPSPLDIEIEDIAHGLARVARWNGQTLGPHAFSVAQHSVLVERIATTMNPAWSPRERLQALLHDSAEYVVGDLISPFKAALGLDYKAFETRLLEAVHIRFGLPAIPPPAVTERIKAADGFAAYFEATCLAGFTEDEARIYFATPDGLPETLATELSALTPLATDLAQQAFLSRFRELEERLGD